MGLTKKIEEKIHQKIAERKENQKQEKIEQSKLRQEEIKARQTERIHQAQERGKRSARQEYGNNSGSSSRSSSGRKSKSVKGYASYAGSVPMFKAVDPMSALIGPSRKSKPKTPSRTTTVTTGNKTIRITEKLSEEEQKKKKQNDYSHLDPFAGFM